MFDTFHEISLRVAVLMGGCSSEREVSLHSGRAVAAALDAAGHDVACFDPVETELPSIDWRQFDACFIALHGGAGEDGRLQTLLDEAGIPYTGSGPRASRVAMSKSATKRCLNQHRVLTPPAVEFCAAEPVAHIMQRLRALRFPLIIKPDSQGCSLGVNVAVGPDQLADCIEAAGRYESLLLAEPLVEGREFTVALLGREPLPALEIVHRRRLFDYETKFHGEQETVRAVEDRDPAARSATRAAREAATAIDTCGLSRVDLIVDRVGRPWVLELNTVPGMTGRSLAPRAAALAGWDMPSFCHRLVCECLSRSEVPA